MPVINTRKINGLVRTTEPVWSNIERLSEACTAWYTYDTHAGVYAWTINEAGNSIAAISEADIIGPIQISGTGLTNLYNSVEMEYPNADIRDQPEYFRNNLTPGVRNEYEPDNTLQMSNEFINNQMQAEYVATVTLRQSRLDKTVVIVMDYTKINLQAGDIIDITSPTYGWTAKEFRIMRVREIEGDDGSLRLEFTCSEYDDSIYPDSVSEFIVGGAPGIRSLGAIGTPGTPTANIISINAIPSIQVTSTVPEGIVDRMQFWAGNVLITGNVANTNFNLVGSVASTNANAFVANTNVVFSTNSLSDGTYAWKTRGINISGTGPYSNASANITFASGNALANTAANAAATSTAVANSATSGTIFQAQLSQGYQYSVNAGKITSIITQSANTTDRKIYGSSTFTIPTSIGNTMGYKIDMVADMNECGAFGGRGNVSPNYYGEPADITSARFELYNVTGNSNVLVTGESSGGYGTFFWTDFAMAGFANLNIGNTYKIEFSGVNYTESIPTANANMSFGWNVFTNNNAGF
jgi:hypothetical protein